MKIFYLVNIVLFTMAMAMAFKKDECQFKFSKENTYTIRGLCMLMMVLHHICFYMDATDLLVKIYKSLGAILTGIYFFLSGYGNYLSFTGQFRGDETIAKTIKYGKWIGKRIISVVLPFFIVYSIIFPLGKFFFLTENSQYQNSNFFEGIVQLRFPTAMNWFIKVILLCYILFFVLWTTKLKENLKLSLLVVLVGMYVIITLSCGMDSVWWSSVLCFPAGVFYASCRDKIAKALRKSWVLLIPVMLVTHILDIYYARIFGVLTCLFACALLVILSEKVNLKNTILIFLGKISFEMYLIHSALIPFLTDKEGSHMGNFEAGMMFILTIGGAAIVHWLATWIMKVRE